MWFPSTLGHVLFFSLVLVFPRFPLVGSRDNITQRRVRYDVRRRWLELVPAVQFPVISGFCPPPTSLLASCCPQLRSFLCPPLLSRVYPSQVPSTTVLVQMARQSRRVAAGAVSLLPEAPVREIRDRLGWEPLVIIWQEGGWTDVGAWRRVLPRAVPDPNKQRSRIGREIN